jgi:hypothetical protein
MEKKNSGKQKTKKLIEYQRQVKQVYNDRLRKIMPRKKIRGTA